MEKLHLSSDTLLHLVNQENQKQAHNQAKMSNQALKTAQLIDQLEEMNKTTQDQEDMEMAEDESQSAGDSDWTIIAANQVAILNNLRKLDQIYVLKR